MSKKKEVKNRVNALVVKLEQLIYEEGECFEDYGHTLVAAIATLWPATIEAVGRQVQTGDLGDSPMLRFAAALEARKLKLRKQHAEVANHIGRSITYLPANCD